MVYDTSLAIFSPDGRLIQVEYAQLASEQGTLVVFSTSPTAERPSISVSIEKRALNRLLIEEDTQKLFLIDKGLNLYMTYAGLSPDAHVITGQARVMCRSYKIRTGEDITLEQLAAELSDFKQKYTIEGGKRPFGIRSVLLGFEDDKPRAFIVEPDGNFSEYSSGSVGQKCQKVVEYLEQNSEEGVRRTLGGLIEVVQGDVNKITSFCIFKDGIEKVEKSYISSYIEEMSNK